MRNSDLHPGGRAGMGRAIMWAGVWAGVASLGLLAGCGLFGSSDATPAIADGTPLTIPEGRVWRCGDCHVNRTAPPKFDSELTKKDEFFCGKCSDAASKVTLRKGPGAPATLPATKTDKLALPPAGT